MSFSEKMTLLPVYSRNILVNADLWCYCNNCWVWLRDCPRPQGTPYWCRTLLLSSSAHLAHFGSWFATVMIFFSSASSVTQYQSLFSWDKLGNLTWMGCKSLRWRMRVIIKVSDTGWRFLSLCGCWCEWSECSEQVFHSCCHTFHWIMESLGLEETSKIPSPPHHSQL